MNELAEFRRENPKVTKKVAEEYFYTLTYMMTGAEHQDIMKSDRIYALFDHYLLKNHKEYDESNPEERHIRLKDYAKTWTKGKPEAGTLFERFPAIRRQLDDLMELPGDTKIRLFQKGDFIIDEPKQMDFVQDFIKNGCYYPGHIFPGHYSHYVDQNVFEKVLRESTFRENESFFDAKSKEEEMQVTANSKRIFPNARFVNNIREIVSWYEKCKEAGFDTDNLIVQANARTPYEHDDDIDWDSLSFFVH